MDHFGIGAAIKGMAEVYFHSARRTGRTTALLSNLKNGDRVICIDGQSAERMRRLCRERGLEVDCIALAPRDPQRVFERGTPHGRTIFDHPWIEQFYALAIERAAKDIEHFQRESSGYGEAHQQTKMAACEMQKWNFPR